MTIEMKTYYIKTYGCQMNASDSDLVSAYLMNLGMQQVEEPSKADIVIINTCSIRQGAEHKVLSILGRIEPVKDKNPNLKVIVAGCMAQRVGEKLKKRFPIIDLIIGAKDIEHFPQYFGTIFSAGSNDANTLFSPLNRFRAKTNEHKVTSFVTIMRGCENYCAYCIVPYVRGAEISRKTGDILDEVKYFVDTGVKDITLLGQNVNSYKDENTDFSDLLEKINKINGLERIRFMTNHPKDLSDKLIDTMAGCNKVCEHIHLPLQSGSDKILNAMNRRYTSADYMKIVDKIRKKIPQMNFTTDILIGFPGETTYDFYETVNLIKKADFDALFVFKYSPRPGTSAAKLEDDVKREIKEERLAIVLDTGNSISSQKNAKLVNTVLEVLVEERQDKVLEGRTRTNKKVFLPLEDNLIGQLIPVKITEGKMNSLMGIREK